MPPSGKARATRLYRSTVVTAPGTSSSHRPTLHELGMDDAVSYEAGRLAQWGHLEGLVGAQLIDLAARAPRPGLARGGGFESQPHRTFKPEPFLRVG